MTPSPAIAPIQVPVSLPPVWNAARLQCVQTNCLTPNSLTRNVGEVLGVFGDSETYRDASGRWRVRSTAKVKNLYALEEALDWVESPKWSPKFPAPMGDLAEGAKAFATYCQRCHAQPYLDKFNAQWNTIGENWSGTNAPSDLADHFAAETYLGQTRYVWKVTTLGFEQAGTDDQFIKAHALARYTVNARATEILDGKMRDGILATLREKTGDVVSSLAARLAELEGRDVTLTGQAIVNVEFNKLKNAQLTSTNPLRKPDGSVMTLILLAGIDRQRCGLVLPRRVPRPQDRSGRARHVCVLPGAAAATHARAAGRLPGSPPQWHRVHRALWPQRHVADARISALPRHAARELLGRSRRVRSLRGGRGRQEGRSHLRRAESSAQVFQADHDRAAARRGR